MKLSELLERLEEVHLRYGDIDVLIPDNEGGFSDAYGLVESEGGDDVVIADKETWEAFAE